MLPDDKLRETAARIRLVAFDVDGVLTDGSILFGDDGTEHKAFQAQDGLGLVMLQDQGISVAIVSSRTSGVVTRRMSELGIMHVLQGVKDKRQAVDRLLRELAIEPECMAFVGDDMVDLPAMSLAGLAIAVANARPQVIARADWTTTAAGGHGAAREVCDLLLQANGRLDDCIESYLGRKS